MKLERLEDFGKMSKRSVLIGQTIVNLTEGAPYYNKIETEMGLAINILVIFGSTELHEAMFADDVNMAEFMDEQMVLIEEVKKDEVTGPIYKELLDEINRVALERAKYHQSIGYMMGTMMQGDKIKELLENEDLKELVSKTEAKPE